MNAFPPRFASLTSFLLLAGAMLPCASALGQTKSAPISIYIASTPGGNYDFVARLVARHLGKHLEGNPPVVPVNMPGGGGIRAANYLFNLAPRDGTSLGLLNQSVAIEEALGTAGIQYKSAELGWVGRVSMILEATSTVEPTRTRSLQDALLYETPLAGTGAGSPSEGYPKLLNGILGSKFKIVSGYNSSAEAILAMERGEVEGGLPSWNVIKNSKPDWIAQKKIHPLVQWGFQRSADLPDVPVSVEIGKSESDRELLTFYSSGEEIARSVAAPPNLPPGRLALLRKAFDEMVRSAEFLEDVQRSRLEFNPLPGEVVQQIIQRTVGASPEVLARVKHVLGLE